MIFSIHAKLRTGNRIRVFLKGMFRISKGRHELVKLFELHEVFGLVPSFK